MKHCLECGEWTANESKICDKCTPDQTDAIFRWRSDDNRIEVRQGTWRVQKGARPWVKVEFYPDRDDGAAVDFDSGQLLQFIEQLLDTDAYRDGQKARDGLDSKGD